jgi:hypothetical protein
MLQIGVQNTDDIPTHTPNPVDDGRRQSGSDLPVNQHDLRALPSLDGDFGIGSIGTVIDKDKFVRDALEGAFHAFHQPNDVRAFIVRRQNDGQPHAPDIPPCEARVVSTEAPQPVLLS